MANYGMITGYISDIYIGETKNKDKEFLGIKFETFDYHENDSGYHDIRIWFTTPAAKEMAQEKIERLYEFAGLEWKGAKATTPQTALKALGREEFAALEIPITVQPNEYNGRVSAQYDVGWKDAGQSAGFVKSGFEKLGDLAAKKLEELREQREKNQNIMPPVQAAAAEADAQVSVYNEDEIPF